MENDMMDLDQLASYLQRDVREVSKMASRGHLPGRKISGQWRFAPAEINHWIETQMHGYSEQQLTALERRSGQSDEEGPLLSALLTASTTAVPLPAGTKASVLKELVKLAGQSWQIYDADAILTAIKQREELASTALAGGVAIPHPRRPLPGALGESLIAFGRTAHAIPFGGSDSGLTDLFFLVLCRDQPTHLRVLARLSRVLRRPGFLDELRAADSATEALQLIEAAESALAAD
jgi:PTS system nitrogen regulatory IIA component